MPAKPGVSLGAPGRGRPTWTLQGQLANLRRGRGAGKCFRVERGVPPAFGGTTQELPRILCSPHPRPQPLGLGKELMIRNCMTVAVVTGETDL